MVATPTGGGCKQEFVNTASSCGEQIFEKERSVIDKNDRNKTVEEFPGRELANVNMKQFFSHDVERMRPTSIREAKDNRNVAFLRRIDEHE